MGSRGGGGGEGWEGSAGGIPRRKARSSQGAEGPAAASPPRASAAGRQLPLPGRPRLWAGRPAGRRAPVPAAVRLPSLAQGLPSQGGFPFPPTDGWSRLRAKAASGSPNGPSGSPRGLCSHGRYGPGPGPAALWAPGKVLEPPLPAHGFWVPLRWPWGSPTPQDGRVHLPRWPRNTLPLPVTGGRW